MFFRRSIPAKKEFNMSFSLNELYPSLSNKVMYNCEINEENYNDVRIIKNPLLKGRIILEEDAKKYGLECFKCTDLINLLEDYFTNEKLTDRRLVSCPISLETMKNPVVLIPSGSVLDQDSTVQLIKNFDSERKNWIDPKTQSSFNAVYSLPLMSFLINAHTDKKNEKVGAELSYHHSPSMFKRTGC